MQEVSINSDCKENTPAENARALKMQSEGRSILQRPANSQWVGGGGQDTLCGKHVDCQKKGSVFLEKWVRVGG